MRVPEDDAVERDSRSRWVGKGAFEELIPERIRGTIEAIVEEELEERWVPRARSESARLAPVIGMGSVQNAQHQPWRDHNHDAARPDRG